MFSLYWPITFLYWPTITAIPSPNLGRSITSTSTNRVLVVEEAMPRFVTEINPSLSISKEDGDYNG
jgi:hypothetical protein